MRPIRTLVAVLFVATIAVAGCSAQTNADQPPSPPSAPNLTQASPPPTHPHRANPAPVDRPALIYAAVLRQYLTSDTGFGGHRFPQISVSDRVVADAGAPGHGAPRGGPIPPALQRAISHALADVGPLTFATSADAVIVDCGGCAHVRGQGILITLGPVQGAGEQAQVGVNGLVACLGANSLTYRVERTSGGWRVAEVAAWGPVA